MPSDWGGSYRVARRMRPVDILEETVSDSGLGGGMVLPERSRSYNRNVEKKASMKSEKQKFTVLLWVGVLLLACALGYLVLRLRTNRQPILQYEKRAEAQTETIVSTVNTSGKKASTRDSKVKNTDSLRLSKHELLQRARERREEAWSEVADPERKGGK